MWKPKKGSPAKPIERGKQDDHPVSYRTFDGITHGIVKVVKAQYAHKGHKA